jgi:hypothetical protein
MGCDTIAKQNADRGQDRPSVSAGASPSQFISVRPADQFMITDDRIVAERPVPLLCVTKKMPPGSESGGANSLNQDGANISGSRQNRKSSHAVAISQSAGDGNDNTQRIYTH